MKIRIIIALTVMSIMVNAIFLCECMGAELGLYAKYACLMDGDSGRVIYSKEGEVAVPIASTTKILTCIIALENGNIKDVVKVSKYASTMPDVQLGIRENEEYYLKDLLYSLMLESHNDSAVAIAEHISGSVEEFASLMNEKATQIGCVDAYFITPNGLDKEDENGCHRASAIDVAKIMRYCITKSPKAKEFIELTKTPSYTFSEVNKKRHFSVSNKNAFLNMMDGVISGKTGFTNGAGYCYVTAVKKDNNIYIAVVLACGWPPHKTYKWSDTKKLIKYGITNYREIYLPDMELDKNVFGPVWVKGAKTNRIDEKIYAQIEIVSDANNDKVLAENDEKIEVKYEIKESVTAPVKKGTIIGNIKYYIGGKLVNVDMIVIGKNYEKKDFKWCLTQVKNAMFF